MMKNEKTDPLSAWVLFEKKAELSFLDLQLRLTELKLITPLETLNDALTLIQADLLELDDLYANLSDLPDTSRIFFFKRIRPKFVALWLFYLERHHLVLAKPVGAKQVLRSFYESELQHLDYFLKRYGFYYSYFRCGMSQTDHLYFLPDLKMSTVAPELPVLAGMSRTAGDYLFARFRASELIVQYILSQLSDLDKPDTVAPIMASVVREKKKLQTQFNLSVDQLGMVTRAALDASVIKGKSFQSLCQELAPLVITGSGQSNVSAGSLRSNAYTGEDVDKHILIRALEKMIRLITEY